MDGAKDLGAEGKDDEYGWGYVRTGTSLKRNVVKHVPTTMDCANDPTYTYMFTPKYYNSTTLTSEMQVFYPNGDTVTGVIDANGVRTFPVVINTAKGFVNGTAPTNVLKYRFVVNGCETDIYTEPITISNIEGPPPPPVPSLLILTTPLCPDATVTGKLLNPTGTVTITLNGGTDIPYSSADSTFSFIP